MNKLIALLLLLMTHAVFAHQNDTNVGRMPIVHPDLGHEGGAVLHTKVLNAWTKVSNDVNSRYAEYAGVADSADQVIAHNFGAAFEELRVIIYTGNQPNLTRVADYAASGWGVAATVASEKISITVTAPATGGPHTFAVVIIHGRGAEKLDDLDDVDLTTPPEDGQALVYDASASEWVPGASGDASFKIQSVETDGTIVIKGGSFNWPGVGEAATYTGSGTTSASLFGDITFDLDTLEPSAVNDTTYWLYVDRNALLDLTTTDTGVAYKTVTGTQFALLADGPFSGQVETFLYAHVGFVRRATAAWSDTIFGTSAFREHQSPSATVNPIVYQSERSIGTVGAVANDQGPLVDGDITFASSAYFPLAGNTTNSASQGGHLTAEGSPAFNGVGFFNRENVANLDGVDDNFSSTTAYFNPGNGVTFAFGGWFYSDNWENPSGLQYLAGAEGSLSDRGFGIRLNSDSTLSFDGTNTAGSTDAGFTIPGFKDGTWKHLVWYYDFASTTLKGYVDGQLVGSDSLANQRTITSFTFRVGARRPTAISFLQGKAQDFFFSQDTFTDADINALYSKRFTNHKQIAGGHELTADSFPFTDLNDRVYFWNLRDLTDGSGNGRNLTNNNSTPFTGLDIYGESGIADFTDSLENSFRVPDHPDLDFTTTMTLAGWFNAKDTSAQELFGKRNSSVSEFSYYFVIPSGMTTIGFFSSDTGTSNTSLTFPMTGVSPGEWHHYAVTFDHGVVKVYVDGKIIGTESFIFTSMYAGAADFYIGARDFGVVTMNGRAQSFMASSHVFSQEDIRKLASARIDRPTTIAVENQDWGSSLWGREDGKLNNQLDPSWLLDVSPTALYVDTGLDSGSKARLKLKDTGFSATVVSTATYNSGELSSAPSFPIAHGLPGKPQHVVVMTEGQSLAGKWESRYDLCSWDETELDCDLSMLTIDGTHRVQIIASMTPGATAIENATATQMGLVQLNKWGQKYLTGDLAGASANVTLSDLTFNNLVIGRTYRVSLHTKKDIDASDVVVVTVTHNGVQLAQIREGTPAGEAEARNGFTSAVFVATASTITFVGSSFGTTSNLYGDGGGDETWASIEELNNYGTETTGFD